MLERPANKLVLLVETEDENNIEQWHRTQDQIFWARNVLMENFMNGHLKSEWTKIVLCFVLTKVNIWKSSREDENNIEQWHRT